MENFLLTNRCTRTRVKTEDNHTLKVFSVFYQHPALLDPADWKLFNAESEQVLMDKDTIYLLDKHLCEFGYEPKTGTILTCKITPIEKTDLDKHWDEMLQFCLEVKRDFAQFCDEETLGLDKLNLKSDQSQDCSDSTSNGPTLGSILEETTQTLPSKLDEGLD